MTGAQASKGAQQRPTQQLSQVVLVMPAADQCLLHLVHWYCRGKPRVYSRRDYPVSFNKTNIKAGGCIVHSINMALVPPSDRQMIDAWVDEIGLRPDPAPQAQWAPEQLPLSMSLEASAAGKKDDAAAAAAGGDSAVAAAPAGGAGSKPATSSSDAARVGGARGLLLAAVAAAGLLL